ncbi:MAG: hypothetical protein Q4C48_12145 [Lachnospiraceae bacterium]|nr:hypothetical protein [Lachnospiraceae bacterium]
MKTVTKVFLTIGAAAAAGYAITAYLKKTGKLQTETDDWEDDLSENKSDADEDNKILVADTTGDGEIDTVLLDTDNDGEVDTILLDTTGDGNLDTVLADTTGDGKIDSVISEL